MTGNVFFISDTHYGHSKMYTLPFLDEDGKRLRPWSSDEEADEIMVERWNSVVTPNCKVYHCGDVAIPRRGIKTLERLNGRKVLIAGNHDSMYVKDLASHFRDIRAYWKIENFILSHVPVHPNSIRNFDCNIHGHLHSYRTKTAEGLLDTRYFNVCVEQIDFRPIEWSELKSRIEQESYCHPRLP